MAWNVSGQSMELCNCNLLCPCWLGPEGVPDQGWCGGGFAFDIERGSSDGVDLGGSKVVAMFEWPGNFFLGNGTGRLYVDAPASDGQRAELEAIFGGKKGGHLEGLFGAVVANWLPTRPSRIQFQWGDKPTLTVDDIGEATLQPVVDGAGNRTTMQAAPALTAFQMQSMDLASSKGSRWNDPDMRSWEGNSGTLHKFNWNA